MYKIKKISFDPKTSITKLRYLEMHRGLCIVQAKKFFLVNEESFNLENELLESENYKEIENRLFKVSKNGQILDLSAPNSPITIKSTILVMVSISNYVCLMNLDLNTTLLFDINSSRKIWEINGIQSFYIIKSGNFIYDFSDGKSAISVFNFSNGTLLWQYTTTPKYDYMFTEILGNQVPKKSEINHVLGVYEGLIWIHISNNIFIGLDKNTGEEKVVKSKPDILPQNWHDGSNHMSVGVTLDEMTGEIYGLGYDSSYHVFDLKSGIYTIYDQRKSVEEHGVKMYKYAGYDSADRIFFYEGDSSKRVACFSRSKREVLWSIEVSDASDKWPALLKVEYGGGRLYVLDHDNTLHVYGEETLS